MADAGRILISCRLVWDQLDEVQPMLESHGLSVDVPRFDGQQLEEEDLLPIVDRYRGILAGDDHLTRKVLETARRLEVISKWGIGVDAIDLVAAGELGIKVFNTPGVFGEELADYAMGFILMLARRQHEVHERVKAGVWHKVRGTSLSGKTLGIVGLGSSGRALARRAGAAQMRVMGYDIVETAEDPSYEFVELGHLLGEADIVSLHIPATPLTTHLINEDSLSTMKQGAWLINVSRGALIDESALVAALESGQVGAAALDVFDREPVEADNPLLQLDDVIVGSHNGSNTREAVERTTRLALSNLLMGLGLEGESG